MRVFHDFIRGGTASHPSDEYLSPGTPAWLLRSMRGFAPLSSIYQCAPREGNSRQMGIGAFPGLLSNLPVSCLESPPAKAGLLLRIETWATPAHRDKTAMNGAQIFTAHCDSDDRATFRLILYWMRLPIEQTSILRDNCVDPPEPNSSFATTS